MTQWQPDYAKLETPMLREMERHAVEESWHDDTPLWTIKLRDIRFELKRRQAK